MKKTTWRETPRKLQCAASTLGFERRRMLKVMQRFTKHYSCHLQSGDVLVWCILNEVLYRAGSRRPVGGNVSEWQSG
jgi:hypothetical protein